MGSDETGKPLRRFQRPSGLPDRSRGPSPIGRGLGQMMCITGPTPSENAGERSRPASFRVTLPFDNEHAIAFTEPHAGAIRGERTKRPLAHQSKTGKTSKRKLTDRVVGHRHQKICLVSQDRRRGDRQRAHPRRARRRDRRAAKRESGASQRGSGDRRGGRS